MAIATIDGNQVNIPDFALDRTVRDLASAMNGYAKSNENLIKKMTSGTASPKDVEKFTKNITEANPEIQKNTRQIHASMKAMGVFEKTLTGTANVVGAMFGGMLTAGTGLTTIMTGVLLEGFMRFGDALNQLTTVGLNRVETLEGPVSGLIGQGMTFDEALDFVLNSSLAFQETGLQTVNLANRFRELTDMGSNLGITLDDMLGVFQDELNLRARLGNMGNLEEAQQIKIVEGMEDMVNTQFRFTEALGESVDEIRNFALNLVRDSSPLQSSLLLLDEELRQNTITQVQEFASVLRATGGEFGGAIADAAVEAAAFGAIGFSSSAIDLVTVLPTLAGAFTNTIQDFQNGILDGEEAAMEFTNVIGNLSETEKQRVFAIARTGDRTALQLNRSIMLFEQSVTKINEAFGDDFRPQEIQRAYNLLGAIPRTLLSTFDQVRTNLLAKFIGSIDDSFFQMVTGSLNEFTEAVKRTVNTIFNDTVQFSADNPENPVKGLITAFNDFVERITARIDQFNIFLDNYFNTPDKDGNLPTFSDFFKEFIFDPFKNAMNSAYDFLVSFFANLINDIGVKLGLIDVPNIPSDAFVGPPAPPGMGTGATTTPVTASIPTSIGADGQVYGGLAGTEVGKMGLDFSERMALPFILDEIKKSYSSINDMNYQQFSKLLEDNKGRFNSPNADEEIRQLQNYAGTDMDALRSRFDTDGDGSLNDSETKELLKTLILISREQVKELKNSSG